ncbi:MAG: hypothetical protein OQK04_08965, partial [Kangiellaceae bacterium]|nr:hypothetical protein [Kangiellaceae bacterium]
HWPGNVRQLENTCRWLSVMANSQIIMPQDLPPEIAQESVPSTPTTEWQLLFSNKLISDYQKGNHLALVKVQSDIEQLLIKTALEITLGKKAEASKILGWGRNTLTRKLKVEN